MKLIRQTVVIILLLAAANAHAAVLDYKWNLTIGAGLRSTPKIIELYAGDTNGNGRGEVLVATMGQAKGGESTALNKVYAFRDDGVLAWEYGKDNEIQDVVFSDLNSDERIDTIISTGQMLQEIQKGYVTILDHRGEKKADYRSTAIMKVLHVTDMDQDSYVDIIGGSTLKTFAFHPHGEKIWEFKADVQTTAIG